jgi:hypothetical protein
MRTAKSTQSNTTPLRTKDKLLAIRSAKTMEKLAAILLKEQRVVQKRAIAALNILFAD